MGDREPALQHRWPRGRRSTAGRGSRLSSIFGPRAPHARVHAFTFTCTRIGSGSDRARERNLIFTLCLSGHPQEFTRGEVRPRASTCPGEAARYTASEGGNRRVCAESARRAHLEMPGDERGGAVRQQWNIIDKGSWCLWLRRTMSEHGKSLLPQERRGKI